MSERNTGRATVWTDQPLPAFYLRLSKADGDKDESNSIENQRNILKRHISRMEDFGGSKVVDNVDVRHLEYIDDGYSGKDFNRPGFQRMLTDCRKGKVSAILVKDLSRLGRDYIEVNSYLEDIFPFLHVRFISVSERYDSGTKQQDEALSLEMQFISMMNTFYLRDCAIKSAAGRIAKWKRGELVSSQTPLGYVCEDIKTGWKVDLEGAAIVRTVFDLALTGLGTGQIATEMNRRGILTPYRYLKSKGLWRGGEFITEEEKMVWTHSTVLNILSNEAYVGTLVQGKRQSLVLGKGISRKAPDEMRYKHEDKHEALVSKEEFLTAQNVIRFTGERTTLSSPQEYVLKSVVRCWNCGRLMVKEARRFRCNGTTQGEFTGCSGSFLECDIEAKVLNAVLEKAKLAEEQLKKVSLSDFDILAAREEIERLKDEKLKKYEQYLRKKASKEEFMEVQERVRERIQTIEEEIDRAREANAWYEDVEETLRPLVDAGIAAAQNGLTRAMVEELIDTVWVSETEVTVDFKADEMLRSL